jgi:hypothetical protein
VKKILRSRNMDQVVILWDWYRCCNRWMCA